MQQYKLGHIIIKINLIITRGASDLARTETLVFFKGSSLELDSSNLGLLDEPQLCEVDCSRTSSTGSVSG